MGEIGYGRPLFTVHPLFRIGDQCDIAFKRRIFGRRGRPKMIDLLHTAQYTTTPLIKHGNVKYETKTGKYDRGGIINRVNNKHRAVKMKNKWPHTLHPNDEAVAKESPFQFIRMIWTRR